MNDTELDALAGEYVLGTLEDDERRDFEHRLKGDAQLRGLVDAWSDRFSGLAAVSAPLSPPTDVWERVASALDGPLLPGTTTVRKAEGEWLQLAPGCECKTLFVDRDRGYKNLLLRMAPGATLPAHDHAKEEECMVLEGEMIIGDARFQTGDFHIAHPGTRHPPVRSELGALVYIRAELSDPVHENSTTSG